MAESKRYYWLKLRKDFFKRHDIQIVEGMTNGKDYVLFYLKLLVESVSHDGELRFSETIPYNEQMLSTITNINIDIVRSAMKVFVELKMIEVMDDSTIYMSEVEKMLGSESWSAERVRKFRAKEQEKLPEPHVTECNGHVTKSKSKSKKPPVSPAGDIAKRSIGDRFGDWYSHYPKKKSQGAAERAFKKINPSEELLKTMILSVEAAKETKGWIKDGGQFIPYPATWLNAKGWEDEISKDTQFNNWQKVTGVLSEYGRDAYKQAYAELGASLTAEIKAHWTWSDLCNMSEFELGQARKVFEGR